MPGRLNLSARRGADFSAVLTWRDSSGALVNLTGGSAKMDVRTTAADTGGLLVQLTTGNGRIVLGGTLGTITLTVAEAVVTALTAQTGWYDLFVTPASGVATPVFHGVFVLEERTTA